MSKTTLHAALLSVQTLSLADLDQVLRLGLRDVRRKPAMGLFFAAIYVVGGWLLYFFCS